MQTSNMQKKKKPESIGFVEYCAEEGPSMAIKTVVIAAMVLVGCSIFKPATVEDLLKTVAEKLVESHGLTVDVFRCNDYEIDRINRKLLMLCEADLK